MIANEKTERGRMRDMKKNRDLREERGRDRRERENEGERKRKRKLEREKK